MARIFWTQAEKTHLAEIAFEFRRTTDLTDIECVRQAQNTLLPNDRRRNLITMTEVPWVLPIWKELTKAQRELEHVAPSVTQAIVPVKHPEAERIAHAPKPFSIGDLPFDQLWTEMGRRLTEMASGEAMQAMVQREVRRQLEAVLPGSITFDDTPVQQPAQPQRKKLMKVFAFGLLNGQQELFKQEYKGRVDFIFTDGSPSLSKLKSVSHNVHWVVQMSKFSNQIKGANKAIDNFHVCPGAITQLREFLNRKLAIFENENIAD